MAEYNGLTNFIGLQSGDIITYNYTGSVLTFELPKSAYRFKCYGAQGGNGGQGGYAEGVLDLPQPSTVFIRVGGAGSTSGAAGFNGGGNISTGTNSGGGGGASDIRLGTDSLYSRIIVAGGGGGKGHSTSAGGAGGGLEGADGKGSDNYGEASGGTQTAGGDKSSNSGSYQSTSGTFGNGGQGYGNSGGGGGGGWYGGGGATHGGGAGGSGYVLTVDSVKPVGYLLGTEYFLTEATFAQGGRTGAGLIVIEVITVDTQKFLARDKNGIKAWDEETETWELCDGEVDEDLFQGCGVDFLPQSVNGLLDNAEILLWTDNDEIRAEPENFSLQLTANVTAPTQTVTQVIPFDLPNGAVVDRFTLVKDEQNGGAVSAEYEIKNNAEILFTYTLEKPSAQAVAGINKINIFFGGTANE